MTDTTMTIGRELSTLIRGAKELHNLLSEQGEHVVDPPAYMLLNRIGEQGPLRLSTLAASVYLDVSTISRQVQDLEQAGWVLRERDPLDRRASLLRLTERGQTVLAAGQEQRANSLRQLLSDWSEDQRQALAEQLGRFNEAIASFRTSAALRSAPRQENAS